MHNSKSVLIAVGLLGPMGCSGPRPLKVAINPADQTACTTQLHRSPDSPRLAFFRWKAGADQQSVEDIQALDRNLSTTRNPVGTHKDRAAVSLGELIYQQRSMSYLGRDADGDQR